MAGDWIPMRIGLPDDPDVVAISMRLQLDEDTVCGKLLRFWGWADQNTSDGNAAGVTFAWLDKRIGVTGFCAALEMRGWISRTADGVQVPDFEKFLGRSGKRRVKTAQRVARHREKAKPNGNTQSVTTEQNRTEQLNDEAKASSNPPPPKRKRKPDDVELATQAQLLYEAYPRKMAREDALKAIRKALGKPDVTFDLLLDAVEDYARSRDGQDPNLTPYPATWFNGGRWTDDRAEWFRSDGALSRAGPKAKPPGKDLFAGNRAIQEREAARGTAQAQSAHGVAHGGDRPAIQHRPD